MAVKKKRNKRKENKPDNAFTKLWLEIKKTTAKNVFGFIVILLALYLILRFLIGKLFHTWFSSTSHALQPLTSCPAGLAAQIKFYDLYNYFRVFIVHGNVLKYFYFLLVPIGIYLLLTNFVWKKSTTIQKLISLAIGILVAVVIYFVAPSIYACQFSHVPESSVCGAVTY